MPTLFGPNRGMRWIVGASTHGCWIGVYEGPIARAICRHLSTGDVFYDLGANVGYHTLVGARAVGSGGRVIAFEPVPRNIDFLRRHIELNDLSNVEVVPAAVVDEDAKVGLELHAAPAQAAVSSRGSLRVQGRRLDSLGLPPPNVLKIDVEGAELMALRGALRTLRRHMPVVVFSTPSSELREACCRFLRDLGYRVDPLPVEGSDFVAIPPRR